MMKIKLPLILGLMILTSACSVIKKGPNSDVNAQVNNIVWGVISFKGKTLQQQDFPNGLPHITFDMEDSKINGSDGCNNFMGLATYKGNSIKTGAIASTKMACPGNTIETDFYDVLASDKLTWRLDSDETLRLLDNGLEVMALKENQ